MAGTGLTGRALIGLRWNYVGTVGRILATFISQIALARLLGPESIGQFGFAALTVTMLALMVEMGLQAALVQTATLSEDDIAVAFGRLLLASSAAAGLVIVLADVIAVAVFANPQAAPVLRVMAPTLIVGAATAVASASLSRNIEFKVIQIAGLISYIAGYLVVGVTAAALGLGVWSLVVAWHVQTVIACVAMLVYSPRRLRPGSPFRRLEIARFGVVIMITNIINWAIDNGPHVAIGRWLGAAQLGQYTVANNLVKVPADHLVRSLQAVLFPLAARAHDNDAGLRRAYLTVLAGVGLVAFPFFTFVALLAEPIVATLLGAKWLAATDVLVPLSLTMILHAVEALAGPTLSGRGEPRVELNVKLIVLLLTLGVLGVTVQWSLVAVGWGVAGVYLVRWIWMNVALGRRLNITPADFARTLCGPLLLAGIAGAVPSALMSALEAMSVHWPAGALLVSTAAAATLVILGVTWVVPRVVLGRYLLALLNRLSERRPAWASRTGLRRVFSCAARAAEEVATHPDGAAAPWTRHKTS